jgi:peptidoglycan hydrolase-like amidase
VLDLDVLKSSRFEISRSGSNFVFRGSGFGHGLGLCQEGAHVMAARGASYQKILEKYFPGTTLPPRSSSVSLARPFKGNEVPAKSIVSKWAADHVCYLSPWERVGGWGAGRRQAS